MQKLLSGCAALTVTVLLLGGCGGKADQTAAAARCLRNAIANQGDSNNCADSSGYEALRMFGPMTASCTHQNGNQYICDVHAPDQNLKQPASGFYNVTYDGKSIVYQPAP